jgi:hypothetical protein
MPWSAEIPNRQDISSVRTGETFIPLRDSSPGVRLYEVDAVQRNGEKGVDMGKIGNEVVARFRDGKVIKGYTFDFKSDKERFHISETDNGKDLKEVPVSQLKAVFFVKTFEGTGHHLDLGDFTEETVRRGSGLKVKVTFSDGEVLCGLSNGYGPNRKGFFIYPAKKESNNDRAFVVRESATAVQTWR